MPWICKVPRQLLHLLQSTLAERVGVGSAPSSVLPGDFARLTIYPISAQDSREVEYLGYKSGDISIRRSRKEDVGSSLSQRDTVESIDLKVTDRE